MRIITAPTGVRFAKLTKAEVEAIVIDNLAIIAVMRSTGELTSVECEAWTRIDTLFRPLDTPAATIDRTIKASQALGLTTSEVIAPATRRKAYERYIGLDQQQRHILRRFKHMQWFEEILAKSGMEVDPGMFDMRDWINAPKADSPEVIEALALNRAANTAKVTKARKADASRSGKATEAEKDRSPNAAYLREKKSLVLAEGMARVNQQAQDMWKQNTALQSKVNEHVAAHMETQEALYARDAEIVELKNAGADKDAEIAKLNAELVERDAKHERERRIMVRAQNTACRLAVELGHDPAQVLAVIEADNVIPFVRSKCAIPKIDFGVAEAGWKTSQIDSNVAIAA